MSEKKSKKKAGKRVISGFDSPEQEAKFWSYYKKYQEIAFNCKPCNRRRVEELIHELYTERGHLPPKQIVWGRNPREISDAMLRMAAEKGEALEYPQLPRLRGSMEIFYIGFYEALTEAFGLTFEMENLDNRPHVEMCKHAGWWMPYKDICFVSERPSVIKRDANGVSHCEDGPAFAFDNGPPTPGRENEEPWEMYYWHGVQVPKAWIMDKENIDPSLALTHENIEQRRCLAEILGWENVLEHPSLKTKILDKDEPMIGTLLEVELPDSQTGPEKFLKVECGTGRTFALPVSSRSSSALEANVWTYFREDTPWGASREVLMKMMPEVRT